MKIFFNIEYVVPDGTLVASLSISTDMSSLKGFRLVPGIAGNHLMETNQLIKIGNGVAESQWLEKITLMCFAKREFPLKMI